MLSGSEMWREKIGGAKKKSRHKTATTDKTGADIRFPKKDSRTTAIRQRKPAVARFEWRQ
jgi:hypothetical protein